jgi:hypothetical protein
MTIGLRIVNEECCRSVLGSSDEQMTFGMPIGLRIVRIELTIRSSGFVASNSVSNFKNGTGGGDSVLERDHARYYARNSRSITEKPDKCWKYRAQRKVVQK